MVSIITFQQNKNLKLINCLEREKEENFLRRKKKREEKQKKAEENETTMTKFEMKQFQKLKKGKK